jgi:hypothetical protein
MQIMRKVALALVTVALNAFQGATAINEGDAASCGDESCAETSSAMLQLARVKSQNVAKEIDGSTQNMPLVADEGAGVGDILGVSTSCTPLKLLPKEDTILSSWIVDPTKIYNVRPFKTIFKMCQEAVKVQPMENSGSTHTSGNEVMQMDKSQQNAVGLDGSYGAFRASVQVKLDGTSSRERKREYQTWQSWFAKKKASWKALSPSDYLTDEAKNVIRRGSAEEIVSKLGSFYANTVYIGGVLDNQYELEYSRSKSSSEVAAEFEGKYGPAPTMSIGGSAKHSSKTSQLSEGTTVHHSWRSSGGDSRIWAEMAPDTSNKDDVRKKWFQSLDDGNMEPSKMYLVPIWKVIKDIDPSKAQQVEHYLKQLWRVRPGDVKFLRFAQGNIFSTMPVCELIRKSCWNVDELGRGCNSMDRWCLKNGMACNAGDIELPPGVKVDMYNFRAFNPWNDLCNHGPHEGSIDRPGRYPTLNRPCAYKFSLVDTSTYVC